MKVKTPYKTVMFYGNLLQIPNNTNWLAVDSDGRLMAYAEKPHVENDVWRAKNGAVWELFDYIEFEGEDWKDTLTYCLRGQQWMFEQRTILFAAMHAQHVGDKSAAEELIQMVVCKIADEADMFEGRKAVFDSFMKHAVSGILREHDVMRAVHDKLFPNADKLRLLRASYQF